MTRTLTAGMLAAIQAEASEFIRLVRLDFSGGTVRYSTGPNDVSVDVQDGAGTQTWTAVGGTMQIGAAAETDMVQGRNAGLAMRLSGVDTTIIATLLTNNYRGHNVAIYRAHLNSSKAIIADPLQEFSGVMNAPWKIDEDRGNGTCTVSTRAVSQFAEFDKRKGLRTNLTSHQALHNGDLFFEFVPTLVNRRIVWGRKIDDSTSGGGRGGYDDGGGEGGGDNDGKFIP